jgi:hypothetical protein
MTSSFIFAALSFPVRAIIYSACRQVLGANQEDYTGMINTPYNVLHLMTVVI